MLHQHQVFIKAPGLNICEINHQEVISRNGTKVNYSAKHGTQGDFLKWFVAHALQICCEFTCGNSTVQGEKRERKRIDAGVSKPTSVEAAHPSRHGLAVDVAVLL